MAELKSTVYNYFWGKVINSAFSRDILMWSRHFYFKWFQSQ